MNNARIPIWIADYVLATYGTGAVMGVPAHDERDFEFARKFDLPIRVVVEPFHYITVRKSGEESSIDNVVKTFLVELAEEFAKQKRLGLRYNPSAPANAYSGVGMSISSPTPSEQLQLADYADINYLPTPAATDKIISWLEHHGIGKRAINYKLRDWLFSRQRYWGEPFPIVWANGKHQALPESELPLEPPALEDFKPTGTGEPPLAKAKDWIRYSENATRETNTMPQWAGSCWYYLRFCDPQNDRRFTGEKPERYWMGGGNDEARMTNDERMTKSESSGASSLDIHHSSLRAKPGGVDLYIGGVEHAVLHLFYARFWHKVLFDLGHVSKPEPFQRLVNQGMILGEDNRKMSKRWGNVIDPLDVIEIYGADAFRCYEMFMGPLEQMKPWSMKGVEGVSRFLARVWRLMMTENQAGEWELSVARPGRRTDRRRSSRSCTPRSRKSPKTSKGSRSTRRFPR